ncbi:MAG: tetratricopeptide repeat protein, partial [Candidatus Nanoarchaeia archaeon]
MIVFLRIFQALLSLSSFLIFSSIFSASAAPVTDDQKEIYIDEQIRLAEALKQREYYQLAIEEYKRIISDFPDDPLIADAWCGLGETFCLAGDYKNGAEAYATFLKKYPQLPISDSVQLAYATAFAKAYPEKLSESVKIISQIAENNAKDEKIRESAIYALGKLYLDFGNSIEAEKSFIKLAEKPIRDKEDKIRI